jgi:hypothetical protein
MRTLYIEGIASYGGPESCVGVPRGRSEALTGGVRAGLLSREMQRVQGADAVQMAEGNTGLPQFEGHLTAGVERPVKLEGDVLAQPICGREG